MSKNIIKNNLHNAYKISGFHGNVDRDYTTAYEVLTSRRVRRRRKARHVAEEYGINGELDLVVDGRGYRLDLFSGSCKGYDAHDM